MNIEFDKNKSISNKKKHGIDFEEAKSLWVDDDVIEFHVNYEDEERFLELMKF